MLVLAGWMALITYWSSQGDLPIDSPDIDGLLHGLQHRLAHLVAFGLVALLARWTFSGLPRSAWLAVALTSLFGASDEWHQSFTAGRHSGIDDWAFDTASAGLAVCLWARLRTTRWQSSLRPLVPFAVGAVFVLGVGLAIRPAATLPSNFSRAALHSMKNEAANGALEFARSTRAVARQIRSTVVG
jgi:VanZ family protein